MKHGREDYNQRIQDAANQIPADEPVFLIRAQDEVSAAAVRAWAHLHRTNGGSDVGYLDALRQADRMEEWPKKQKATLALRPLRPGAKPDDPNTWGPECARGIQYHQRDGEFMPSGPGVVRKISTGRKARGKASDHFQQDKLPDA